jgi:hypothetical protein
MTKLSFNEHFEIDVDKALDGIYQQLVLGGVFSVHEMKEMVEAFSPTTAKMAETNPEIFAGVFDRSFSRYKRSRIRIRANDGSSHVMDELVTVTTRGGSDSKPMYIYVGNPTYDKDDHASHVELCDRNAIRAVNRANEKDAFGRAHFPKYVRTKVKKEDNVVPLMDYIAAAA